MKFLISFLLILLAFVSFGSTASNLEKNDFSFSVDHSPGEFIQLENSLPFLTLDNDAVELCFTEAINETQYDVKEVSFIKINNLESCGLIYEQTEGRSGIGKQYNSRLIYTTPGINALNNSYKIYIPKAKYIVVYGLRHSKIQTS